MKKQSLEGDNFMICRCKRIGAGILTAIMVMSSLTTFDAKASSGGSPGGSGELEGVLSDVFSVIVPTEANRPADENTLYMNAFDFILDPKGLASQAGGSLAGKNLEPDASVYFQNIDSGSAYDYSSTSDGFTVINNGMVDVDVTLKATLTGMDGVRLTSDKSFADDKSPSAYLALTDNKGKTSAVDKFGAAIKTTLKGKPDGYKVIYDHSSGKYQYQIKNDAELLKDNIKFIDYTFRLTGACNSAGSWFKLSGYLEPVIKVEWHVAARPKNLAPSIIKTSYVMNFRKPLLVDVDLGSGNLAATGIKSITYTNPSGATSTLTANDYVFTDGVLKFRAACISSVIEEGVKQRAYTITFNDKAATKKVVTLVANDDTAPSIAKTNYEIVKDQPVLVDIDLGSGILGAKGISAITFVNLNTGNVKTLPSDNYTLANGTLTFNKSYINSMFDMGITSRTYTVILDDLAKTQLQVTLSVGGVSPSININEYTIEKDKTLSIAVDRGSGALEATGIKSITFVNLNTGIVKTVPASDYTFVNDEIVFTESFINNLLTSGLAYRDYTVTFDNAVSSKAVVKLKMPSIAPSIANTDYKLIGGQSVKVDIDMGVGALSAKGISAITFVNPNTGNAKTLSTDDYSFANGVLEFKASCIDWLINNGVASRVYTIILDDAAKTKLQVTFSVDGNKPSIQTTEYTIEKDKALSVGVNRGSGAFEATGVKSITFVNLNTGNVKTVPVSDYTFANDEIVFTNTFVNNLLSSGLGSRDYIVVFNDVASSKATITLKVPDMAPSVEQTDYKMAKDQPVWIKINMGSGALGATGIKSITYGNNTVVPSSYYVIVDGSLKLRATYINGVVNAGIKSREYTITFNDKNGTQKKFVLQQ